VRLVDGAASYLHRDQLNSVVLITDAAGAKAREETFLPFGLSAAEDVALPAVAEDAKGFIGERYDSDAGLQYLNARYYDPELGLFLQPDWFEVTQAGVGTNRYSYSFNDPVNAMDPHGNCVWDACVVETIVAAVTLILGALAADHASDIIDNGRVDGSSPLGNPTGMIVSSTFGIGHN
jgi:RHS repeat-associated protein